MGSNPGLPQGDEKALILLKVQAVALPRLPGLPGVAGLVLGHSLLRVAGPC